MSSAQDLKKIANRLRGDVLEMVSIAGSGHVGGPLSSADLFAVLYFSDLVSSKDKVVLSCGHYCPILYAALARSGAFPTQELSTFMQKDSRLPGHPERGSVPGIEASSGPLGQGVSVATGLALAQKMRHGSQQGRNPAHVYCVMSDGELQEGQVWEAFTFAVQRRLNNLIFVVDANKIQIEHYVSELADYGNLAGRFESFGLHTLEVDGHDVQALLLTLQKAKDVTDRPTVVLMHTIAGKGVTFMENQPMWHDKVPTKEQLHAALLELGVTHE